MEYWEEFSALRVNKEVNNIGHTMMKKVQFMKKPDKIF